MPTLGQKRFAGTSSETPGSLNTPGHSLVFTGLLRTKLRLKMNIAGKTTSYAFLIGQTEHHDASSYQEYFRTSCWSVE